MSRTEVWEYLHDGTVSCVRGEMPGEVIVTVEIPYLRSRFPGSGEAFELLLHNCTQFEFEPYDGPLVSTIPALSKLGLEVLSLSSEEPIGVNCSGGTLALQYEAVSIQLDSGEAVTLAELDAANLAYWDEWETRRGGTT